MKETRSTIDSLGETVRFLKEFVRDPNITGAVAPSSVHLAQTIVDWIDWENTKVILEWGPGTGAFTKVILERKPTECRYLAMELNPELCEILRQRFPGIDICQDSVSNVASVCENECIESADCVVCGLPWATFSEAMQDEFLEAMMCVLPRDGQFTTFAYIHGLAVPAAWRFRRKLQHFFSRVTQSEVVWLNLPPAFVYRCRR